MSSAAPNKKAQTSPTSRARSRGRELALKYLYQADLRGGDAESFAAFAEHQEEERRPRPRSAAALAAGVLAKKTDLDSAIARVARNWSISRMPVIDRNILRIGAFELLGDDPLPRGIVINEAIELAKRFSTADSGKFINGILDKIGRAGDDVPGKKES